MKRCTFGSDAIAEVGPIRNMISICRHGIVWLMVELVTGYVFCQYSQLWICCKVEEASLRGKVGSLIIYVDFNSRMGEKVNY